MTVDKLIVLAVIVGLAIGASSNSQVIYERDGIENWYWDALAEGQKVIVGWDDLTWQQAVGSLPSNIGKQIPPIDWEKELPILVTLGQCPTGGYAVQVQRIMIEDDQLVIMINRRSPRPDEFVTMALT